MTTPSSAPKVFISHSHADKPVAEELARALMERSVNAWLDKWEIQPGDSLIQKIFNEGLSQCAVFLVLLSPESVTSKWVREELDVALVRRLEGATRVVPVMVAKCEIPMPLRALLWIDLPSYGLKGTASRIADVANGKTEKPVLRNASRPARPVEGLSQHAAAIALALAPALAEPGPRWINGPSLAREFELNPEQINDAVDELAALGLVKVHRFLGTSPFDFGDVEPTYALGLHLGADSMGYNPTHDIAAVAAAVAALKNATGQQLAEHVQIAPGRINQAVAYLDDYGYAYVSRALGTAPFTFFCVEATPATRRFVLQHAT